MKLSGNTGLCGGIPYGVSQRLQLTTDGTSLQYPCFSKEIELLLGGEDTSSITFSGQVSLFGVFPGLGNIACASSAPGH